MASAGPYASLHLAPDRQPHLHMTTLFFLQAGCPSCRPTNSVKALKAISRYQNGNNGLDLNEARDDGFWGRQWHQLDHMQTICTSLQTDNHTNTSSLNFYGPDALYDTEPTVSKHRSLSISHWSIFTSHVLSLLCEMLCNGNTAYCTRWQKIIITIW